MQQMETTIDRSVPNNSRMPKIVNKIRLEAITRKAIREGKDFNSIANTLMADVYFREKEEIFGVKKAAELTRDTIQKALDKEKNNDYNRLN